jgi:hypothetical protein
MEVVKTTEARPLVTITPSKGAPRFEGDKMQLVASATDGKGGVLDPQKIQWDVFGDGNLLTSATGEVLSYTVPAFKTYEELWTRARATNAQGIVGEFYSNLTPSRPGTTTPVDAGAD